jgi:hypothetical protein
MAALVNERDVAAAVRALPPDPVRQAMRIVALDGSAQTVTGSMPRAADPEWAVAAARGSALHPTLLTVSPIHGADSVAFFDFAFPIHSRRDGESLTGWLVDTRRVRAQGATAVRQLADSAAERLALPELSDLSALHSTHLRVDESARRQPVKESWSLRRID